MEATLLVGRFAKGAFTQKSADIPLLKEKLEWLMAFSGTAAKSYAFREIRNVFNRFPKRELFYANAASLKDMIDRIVYMTGDDEIATHSRRGPGYVALSIAFSRLRYSYKTEEDLRQALSEAFGRISFSTSEDLGAVSLLLFYFESDRAGARGRRGRGAQDRGGARLHLGGPRVRGDGDCLVGERQGRKLFDKYIRRESRSGLYREATPPEEVPQDIQHLENLEGRLEVRILPRSADTVALKLYTTTSVALTDILRTLQNLGLTVTEELRIPIVLPDDRRALLYRLETEAAADRVTALMTGEERFVDALRALDEERATDDALNGLVLAAGLSWREVEVLRTLRNHLLQIRTHYNAETVNGVLLRNSAVAGCVYRAFAARFDPRPRATARPPSRRPTRRWWPGSKPCARWRRTRSCAVSRTWCGRRCARTSSSAPSGPSSRSRWTAARSRACPRRGRCSRSTCTRACWRASTCAAARSRAAASAGATATTTSAPRSWAS